MMREAVIQGLEFLPFFDSMLVKVSAWGRTLKGASYRLHRTLREFRIRGVKTNIGFLENVISNRTFYRGEATVKFIDNHPELFQIPRKMDRGTKTLRYLADVIVNGNPDVKHIDTDRLFRTPIVPSFDRFGDHPKGSRDRLKDLGREGFVKWLKDSTAIQYTDTTFRDAHQSLLATRVRSVDMLNVAEGFAKNHPQIFSMEVWGGATFDVCMRFLHESPWKRLQLLRQAMPNMLLQMLLRGSNAVGYKAYPDNLIEKFIEKSAESGIDIFRIFDSLNWVEAMKVSIRAVRERTESLAEACICYTGDLTSPTNKKYSIQYYLDMARQLEDEGAHILAIKDMAGLLKPLAAEILIKELKSATDLPIHLHTHDTSSIQSATYLKAIEAGVDVIDLSLGSVSGLTSQPNFNSMVASLENHPREQPLDLSKLNEYSNYWEDVREFYYPFESGLKAGTAQVYEHEIPGGQYSNLRPQSIALGLEGKFEQIKQNYRTVNEMFGNIVKVTPSSKVVGDMALYMTSNNLTVEDIMDPERGLSFPDSVIGFFKGNLGQPVGGFPKELQKIVLKGENAITDRPNKHLEPIDFHLGFEHFQQKFPENTDFLDFLSHQLYPKVFEDFYSYKQVYGEVWYLPTLGFFYGLKQDEETLVQIANGKSIIIKMLFVSEPDPDGMRTVSFELNGQTRRIKVRDHSFNVTRPIHRKAELDSEIGAPLQGRIAKVHVSEGETIKENDLLFVIEAMKMETSVTAVSAGKVKKVHLQTGIIVEQDDLVVELVLS